MALLFHCEGDDGRMLAALRERLPGRTVHLWSERVASARAADGEIAGGRGTITDAVVWRAPPAFFDGLDALERVHSLGAGVDDLLAHPGLPPAAILLRLEDAGMGAWMAEYVLHGVLRAQRGFADMEAAARERRWAHAEVRARRAADTPVGILGAGVLGGIVAERLVANGYPVGCWSRSARALPAGVSAHAGEEALGAFLAATRVLVCLLPLTEATRDILDAALFEHLPRGAWLINVGRGEHLVEADLSAALDAGRLGGAVLDVFREEPLPPAHPFWADPRITVTPHLAGPSQVRESVEFVVANLEAAAAGKPLRGRVERRRGY